jgi:eukaryotic-like serine/threonine-protein kinase
MTSANDGASPDPEQAFANTIVERLPPVDLTDDPGAHRQDPAGFAARYEAGRVLGEGGMGEVRLCRDRRIGRDVAVKVIRGAQVDRPEARARFEREARVLGQLEHPSIVPIYDLGVDADGAPYFTMRRLGGQTLEQVLHGLRDGRAGIAQAFSRSRLLAVFASIAQAVAFAHARGVVHRDLKPANVMLGDFGEVYVLDWGLAKVIGAVELPSASADPDPGPGSSPATRAGEAIGTPGYMAPEQIRGELERVDERTDVYALGAILFEILTYQPLHRGATIPALYASALDGADARASVRAPDRDVPPELEAACVRATRQEPVDRFPTVRELVAVVEGYLAGDRDLERRRAIAAEHALAALRADSRQTALREATAALALDPKQPDAHAVLARLLLSPPASMPAEARRELDASGRVVQRAGARSSLLLYLGWLGFVPLVLVLGVRDWTLFAIAGVLLGSTIATSVLAMRAKTGFGFASFVLGAGMIGVASSVLGPHILVPNLAATSVLAFVLFGEARLRIPAIACGLLAFLIPWMLQLVGVVPDTYHFSGGGFRVEPGMVELSEWGVHVLMISANLAMIAPISLFVGAMRDQVERGEEALFLRAWNLRHLLPDDVRP